MFPVPAHLQRTGDSIGGDHVAGPQVPHRTTTNSSVESVDAPNTLLDLLQPLTQDEPMKTEVVVTVRKQLQEAVNANKSRTHQLVLDNYPAISHHVRTAAEVQKQLETITKEVTQLEKQIEAGGSTSLLPPLLSFLEEHSFHVIAHAKAQARLRTLKNVSARRNAVQKLESAIWSGHGADSEVLDHLKAASADQTASTKVDKIMTARVRSLRDLVVEQLITTYHRVISFSTEKNAGAILTIKREFALEQSQLTRSSLAPRPLPKAAAKDAPVITLHQLFEALDSVGELQTLLTSTRKLLLKSIVEPLLPTPTSQQWTLEESSAGDLSVLRLKTSEASSSTPVQALDNLQRVYTFATSHLTTPSFQSSLRTALLQNTLEYVVQSTIPDSLDGLPAWLETTRRTVEFEDAIGQSDERPLKTFADSRAVQTWANRRRRMVADRTRTLIDGPGGWNGWDGEKITRETEISEFVEVEVETEEPSDDSRAPVEAAADPDFGWGFDEDGSPKASTSQPPKTGDMDVDVDDGWGFDESTSGAAQSSQQPEDDGWDFDDAAVPVPEPTVPKKPVREAKKLGKLKNKTAQKSTSPSPSPATRSPRASFGQESTKPIDDGWSNGWEDQGSPKKRSKLALEPEPASVAKPKRIEVQERKKKVQETLLVSVACGDVVKAARSVLQDSVALNSVAIGSSAEEVEGAQEILRKSARDVFDLYRALMPLAFGRQLRDVPSIAMQLYNDCHHLADVTIALNSEFDLWSREGDDLETRLRVFGQRSFEAQLSLHKDSLAESLREAEGFVDTVSEVAFRRCERAVHQVTHKLESLDRVWRGVLAASTRQEVMGQLVDYTVSLIASDILALPDITELESSRIGELCKLVHPLDQLFMNPAAEKSSIVAVVPHWLKFCYVSELMQASLVDIIYLFDTGALVDFEVDEITNLIRALFAETQQRANAVDHVQAGHPTSHVH